MNEETIKRFRKDFERAVEALELQYNAKISLGNISYNSAGFHTKLELRSKTEDGKLEVDPRHEFNARMAFKEYLRHEGPVIGHKFELRSGTIVRVVDYDTKKPKYPVIYEHGNQKYKGSPQAFLRSAE